MSNEENAKPTVSPATQALADLVARRKAASEDGSEVTSAKHRRRSERAAAAQSQSKSKPALRK